MKPKPRKQRRWVRGLWWLTAGGLLLLGLVPLWFPWVLKPVASHYGLGFAVYDRIGWTRFALTGVRGAWDGAQLQAQRVESVLPTTWLWRRFNDRTNGPPLLKLSDGLLLIVASTTNTVTTTNAAASGSTDETLNQIIQIGWALRRWLPAADLTNCTLQIDSHQVSIPYAHWRAGRLEAVARLPVLRGEIELAGQVGDNLALEVSVGWAAYAAALHGGFSRSAAGWCWNSELGWLTNRAELTARFATNGWWPVQAQLDFQRWQIPAASLPVEGYENLVASLTAHFVSNRFDLQATGFAQPTDLASQQAFPKVAFSLGADGNPNGVNLNTLNIQTPWLQAELTNAVGFNWTGELRAEPAQLHVAMDLVKLPGANLAGQMEGFVQIKPQGSRPPVAQFRFSAGQLSAGPLDAKSMLVRGEFAVPLLKLDELQVDFADGSALVADGSFDGATRRIVGGHWKLSGGFVQTFLPGLSYAELAAAGELNGALTNLTHSGEAAFTNCRIVGLKPFDFRAKWSGQNQQLTQGDMEWTAGKSVLSLGAVADIDISKREVAAKLHQLSLRRAKQELYALQEPCAITFRAGAINTSERLWTLAVDAFNWRSQRHAISATAALAWPAQGNTTFSLTNVALADFSDFLSADITNIFLTELAGCAHWSNGPVHSVISATGSLTNSTGRVFGLRGNVKTGDLLVVEQLALANGYTPTLAVTGSVPLKIILGRRAGLLVWDQAQSIALAGTWRDAQPEALAVPLGTWGELALSRPEFRFHISGTPEAPSAELAARATQLAWQSRTNNTPSPRLDDLQLVVAIHPDAIRLKTLVAKLDGQPIRANGEWPLSKQDWQELWFPGKLPDWHQAQGHLELAAASVAAFAAFLPDVLAPEGSVSATLDLKPGKQLAGVLSLTNAATRPLGTFTPLRDIAALVRFDGTHAVLADFRGQLGGQPVRADGFVTVTALDGSGLDYQVNLHGTNVPLARSPELLLRGDFALLLRGGSNLPPVLAGAVTLHDGLYVQNASALVWSTPRRPEWRPPYFSVTNAPFADWKLKLAVRGDRFLRLRTPVFSGVASADFQLSGSLRTPVLTGDARVNSGRMVFPFGSLTINQGFASFNGNDPRGPDLQLNASGRNYRYELRLEVNGPADGANVILSATPPLTAEEILLMLTAGAVPQSDFSFSSSARAGRLGTFLGSDLLSRYLGTDPTDERLVFRTGESISGEGRLTYSVEYRLTDRWSIVGAYDEFNAFNTDLKWKIFTR